MPELPEVEEVRRTLEPYIIGKMVRAVRVERADFISPRRAPIQQIIGRQFKQTLRHGKKLFLELDDSQTLLIHLGMSGRVDCVPENSPAPKHTHVRLLLESGTEVRLRDPRRFGGLWYYATLQMALEREITGKLGPDALRLQPADFAHWKNAGGKLKARLLSQKDVAGLGNIYVDETLWMARLHPLQRVDRLAANRIAVLVEAIHAVLEKSIASGGTTLRDYRNVANQPGDFARHLQAYGRSGLPCLRCASILKKATIAGRTTVFCPRCQRLTGSKRSGAKTRKTTREPPMHADERG